MKKFITLMFCLGALATSFAQYNHQQNNDDRNYRNGNRDDRYANSSGRNYSSEWRHFNHGNIFSAKERDFRIQQINRDFAFKIEAIQCDRYLRRREKRAAIRDAEAQRSRQIQLVNERFNCNF